MSVLTLQRLAIHTTVRSSRMVLLACVLFLAQIGIVMHPMHAYGKQDGQTVESTCAFCFVGTHLEVAPKTPRIHLDRDAQPLADVLLRHVCDVSFLVSPRLTCGPPFFA